MGVYGMTPAGCVMALEQQAIERLVGTFAELPDPGAATTFDELVVRLRLLKAWAGNPSYERITGRVNEAWTANGRPSGDLVGKTTVVDCFRSGRRRLNIDLVVAIVQALHPDAGYVTQWRQALRVISGETSSASQVRVQDRLPPDLPGFTGRAHELDRIARAMHRGTVEAGKAAIVAVVGMAGVGKTQLAIHAGHLLAREQPFHQVLFVNLRGFSPDPLQPPADPNAVLDGFLRLLGVPGHQIPHSLDACAATYRKRLAGTRTLIVLDNAADGNQVSPLLPDTTGCLVLVTSRRRPAGLGTAAHLPLDVFSPTDALTFLGRAELATPAGPDPNAPARIAARCGHLPLALGLVAAHIRRASGWTLTDHADRLDERHHARRLEVGVELALELSYRHLPAERRRALRLVALHPGQDLDGYAAAALTGSDRPALQEDLDHLCSDHLLQVSGPGRYTLHDLVRAYATTRSGDEDSPSDRRAALTRLFDHYLAAVAAAMDTLHPAETHLRPRIPPSTTPLPALADPNAARAWLDSERPNLVAVAAHSAIHGWPTHATRLSTSLFRYLHGGHLTDALIIHTRAHDAARLTGDLIDQAHALENVGVAHSRLGRNELAAEHLHQALSLFRQAGDIAGLASALKHAGNIDKLLGNHVQAIDHYHQALTYYREIRDRSGEGAVLGNLGSVEARRSRYGTAIDYYEQALAICREAGTHDDQAWVLNNLGDTEVRSGRYRQATQHLHQALTLFHQLGNRSGEAWTLNSIGELHAALEQPAQATEHYRQALALFVETGDRDGEAWALNDLGAAAHSARRFNDALHHHSAAHAVAIDTGDRQQQAHALTGLGRTYHLLDQLTPAHEHYQAALALYTDLDLPEAAQIRTHLHTIHTVQTRKNTHSDHGRAE